MSLFIHSFVYLFICAFPDQPPSLSPLFAYAAIPLRLYAFPPRLGVHLRGDPLYGAVPVSRVPLRRRPSVRRGPFYASFPWDRPPRSFKPPISPRTFKPPVDLLTILALQSQTKK